MLDIMFAMNVLFFSILLIMQLQKIMEKQLKENPLPIVVKNSNYQVLYE